jgi:hypothetical protein
MKVSSFFKNFQKETFWRPIHSCWATNFQCNSQNRKIVAGNTINEHLISYHNPAITVLDCGIFKALLIRSRLLSPIYIKNEAMNAVNIMTNYHLKIGVKSPFEMSCLTNIPKKGTSLVWYWKAYNQLNIFFNYLKKMLLRASLCHWHAWLCIGRMIVVVVCFPGVTTHCGCIFHSLVAGLSLLVFEVSWSQTTTRHSR